MDNVNSKEYISKIRQQVIENLKRTAFAPSVQMTDVPRAPLVPGIDDEAEAILDDEDEDENKDTRTTKRRFDKYVEKEGELSESEDEEELASNGVRRQPGFHKRRNQANHKELGSASPSAHQQSLVHEADEKMDDVPETAEGPTPPAEKAAESHSAEPSEKKEEKSQKEAADVDMPDVNSTAPTRPEISNEPGDTSEKLAQESVPAAASTDKGESAAEPPADTTMTDAGKNES